MDIIDLANESLYQDLLVVRGAPTERIERAGVCVDCNGVIPEQRLMAVPNALRCLECQEEYEHLQKVVYGSMYY